MKTAVYVQHLLPHRLLSKLVRSATRWRFRPWKNLLIRLVVRKYNVDMTEANNADPASYPSFNAFFTRALKPGARRADPDPGAILSPADGRISAAGEIDDGRILQAKGQTFTVGELLGDDSVAEYRNGSFVTIYLSPRDYHRVHMPLNGTLQSTVHVPGRIFSVAPFAVEGIPRVFARNERLVCHFDGDHGPFAVVMVGAMLVSGVQTVWAGEVIPPYARRRVSVDCRGCGAGLGRFEEMARFNMGSTVVLLLPPAASVDAGLCPEHPVRLGQRIGNWPRKYGVL